MWKYWFLQEGVLGVDEDKMSHEDAAKKWLADNKSVWQKWTK